MLFPETISVSAEQTGYRLDKLLVERFPDISRSQIQKAIKDGLVLVGGKKVAVHHFLKTADEITIKESSGEGTKENTAKQKKISQEQIKKAEGLLKKVKIITEEKDFMIIEKPAGLLVHPTDTSTVPTLADWLSENYPALKKIGENPARPAIVHRLDKDVSGLMIIPTTQDGFDYFKSQFKQHTITKKYIALVEGPIERDEGEINLPIGRSKTKPGLFAARPLNQDGKKAITRFKVKKRFHNFTLLEVEILTGRTHQIRVHLLSQGHPVAGDRLYHPKLRPKDDPGRIFLHAAELIFAGTDGKEYHFESKLPNILKEFEDKLK